MFENETMLSSYYSQYENFNFTLNVVQYNGNNTVLKILTLSTYLTRSW